MVYAAWTDQTSLSWLYVASTAFCVWKLLGTSYCALVLVPRSLQAQEAAQARQEQGSHGSSSSSLAHGPLKRDPHAVRVAVSAPPLGADSVPTYLVAGIALCDVFRKSVQRKMRSCECDILKKWSASVIGRVLLEMVNGRISYRDSSIVARAPLNGREFHIVLPMCLWTEEAALVLEVIGMLKAIAEGHSVKVPLA